MFSSYKRQGSLRSDVVELERNSRQATTSINNAKMRKIMTAIQPTKPEALLGFDNLLITPHLAGWSPEATAAQLEVFMANVTGHFSGSGAVVPV